VLIEDDDSVLLLVLSDDPVDSVDVDDSLLAVDVLELLTDEVLTDDGLLTVELVLYDDVLLDWLEVDRLESDDVETESELVELDDTDDVDTEDPEDSVLLSLELDTELAVEVRMPVVVLFEDDDVLFDCDDELTDRDDDEAVDTEDAVERSPNQNNAISRIPSGDCLRTEGRDRCLRGRVPRQELRRVRDDSRIEGS